MKSNSTNEISGPIYAPDLRPIEAHEEDRVWHAAYWAAYTAKATPPVPREFATRERIWLHGARQGARSARLVDGETPEAVYDLDAAGSPLTPWAVGDWGKDDAPSERNDRCWYLREACGGSLVAPPAVDWRRIKMGHVDDKWVPIGEIVQRAPLASEERSAA